jgi:hypothetical protein
MLLPRLRRPDQALRYSGPWDQAKWSSAAREETYAIHSTVQLLLPPGNRKRALRTGF